MPDFTTSTLEKHLPETTGAKPRSIRMMGNEGYAAVGKGDWVNTQGVQWKTFMAYCVDQASPLVAGLSIEVHGAMELNEDDKDGSHFAVVGTLTDEENHFSTEEPWRFMRVEVKAVGAGQSALQVGLYGIGV